MEKKARIGQSALLIIGIIYTALGGTFVILGIALAALLRDSDAFMVGLIFGGIGAIFLILGIIFLIVELCKKKRSDALLASGHYILGEVVDIAANINVNVNGRYPYHIIVQYIDPHGVRHIFRSPGLRIFRDPELLGKKVKVYVENDNFKHYYVDVDEILPKYVEH
ncbi:MAG: DUF3592 domain-containing protein [Oscillospiraceae bacterium]|jgi:hypothetical protein